MSAPKRIYGLLGKTLSHSFSRDYFNRKFNDMGLPAEYLNYEINDIGLFRDILADNPDICGLNVTIPYKQSIIPYLDDIDHAAAQINAVNVIKILRHSDGTITTKGYNTDIIGFSESIAPMLTDHHRKALVLGSGGASKAVATGLRQLGLSVAVVSRREGKADLTYAQLTPEVMSEHLVVVNTTPLGMYPDTETYPDIPYRLLTPSHVCYDCVYNPVITLFMKRSAEHGAATKNGLEMLIGQAEAAWMIWNDTTEQHNIKV